MAAFFSDDIDFLYTFGFWAFFVSKFVGFLAYLNRNMCVTGLFWNGAFLEVFCDNTVAAWIVVTNAFDRQFSRFFTDLGFDNVRWF